MTVVRTVRSICPHCQRKISMALVDKQQPAQPRRFFGVRPLPTLSDLLGAPDRTVGKCAFNHFSRNDSNA